MSARLTPPPPPLSQEQHTCGAGGDSGGERAGREGGGGGCGRGATHLQHPPPCLSRACSVPRPLVTPAFLAVLFHTYTLSFLTLFSLLCHHHFPFFLRKAQHRPPSQIILFSPCSTLHVSFLLLGFNTTLGTPKPSRWTDTMNCKHGTVVCCCCCVVPVVAVAHFPDG